jgi:hypothetical protein
MTDSQFRDFSLKNKFEVLAVSQFEKRQQKAGVARKFAAFLQMRPRNNSGAMLRACGETAILESTRLSHAASACRNR